jgi:hypothetical protein
MPSPTTSRRLRAASTATAAAIALLGAAPTAQAEVPKGAGQWIAERLLPSRCSGQTIVTEDATLITRGVLGQATGMDFDAVTQTWSTVRCAYSADPSQNAIERCQTEIHEYLHLALEQAEHVGMLDPDWLETTSLKLCDPPPPPPSQREQLITLLRSSLPKPATWTIACTTTSPKMRCKASRAGSRTRRWRAGVRPGSVWTRTRGGMYESISTAQGA